MSSQASPTAEAHASTPPLSPSSLRSRLEEILSEIEILANQADDAKTCASETAQISPMTPAASLSVSAASRTAASAASSALVLADEAEKLGEGAAPSLHPLLQVRESGFE